MSTIGIRPVQHSMPHFETSSSFLSRPNSNPYTSRPSGRQSSAWLHSGWSKQAFSFQSRPLTPPLDMNTTAHYAPHSDHRGPQHPEDSGYGQRYPHVHYHSSSIPPPTTVNQMSNGRPLTPYSQSHDQSRPSEQSNQPKSSNNNSIAPFLQIPRSINNSGGSLSELAAQVRVVYIATITFSADIRL